MTAVQNLTLYNIETELMELMTFRDSLFEDRELTPQERDESLKVIDERIRAYVLAEVKKVDGIAHYLREFEARAEIHKKEGLRLKLLYDQQINRYNRLSDLVLSIMLQTGQQKLEGKHSTFKLVKNPPSVDVVQPGLVPDNYQRLTVTMSPDTWNAVKKAVLRNEALVTLAAALMECKVSEPEVEKEKARKELKSLAAMNARFDELVEIDVTRGHTPEEKEECIKLGQLLKVNRGIPGCRLITDRKRLEVK